jgi:superfamily II DNA or RNA helicase
VRDIRLIFSEMIDSEVATLLITLVFKEPGMTGGQYTRILQREGHKVDKTRVNRCLYYNKEIFDSNKNGSLVPAWTLNDEFFEGLIKLFEEKSENETTEKSEIILRPWQVEAKNAWINNRYKGIIQATKNSGKKTLALSLIVDHISEGFRIAVLVNSKAKVSQWTDLIDAFVRPLYPKLRLGFFIGGEYNTLKDNDIIIGTFQATNKYLLGLSKGMKGLILVDECQTIATPTYSRCLEEDFERRLGFSSVLYREDIGVDQYLTPYFGKKVYELSLIRAFVDNYVDGVDILFKTLQMTEEEKTSYDYSTKFIENLRTSNIEANLTLDSLYKGKTVFNFPKKILLNSERKFEYFKSRLSEIKGYKKSVIFTDISELVEPIKKELQKEGIMFIDLTDKKGESFRENLNSFNSSSAKVLLLSHLTNAYAHDFCSFDYCLILGSDGNDDRLSQKIECLLQPYVGTTPIKVEVLCLKDTYEDPKVGAYYKFEEFFDVEPIKTSVKKAQKTSITLPQIKQVNLDKTVEQVNVVTKQVINNNEEISQNEFEYKGFNKIIEKEITLDIQLPENEKQYRVPNNMEKARITIIGDLAGKKNEFQRVAKSFGIDDSFLDFFDYHLDGYEISQTIKQDTSDVIVGPNAHSNNVSQYFRKNLRTLPKQQNARQIGKGLKLSIQSFEDALKRTEKYNYLKNKKLNSNKS